jgi:protein TonB
LTAASHLSRAAFLAVSAAAHLAAIGALHPGAGREPATTEERTDVAVDVVAADPAVEPPAPEAVAGVPAIVPSPARPAPPVRSHDPAPLASGPRPAAPSPEPIADPSSPAVVTAPATAPPIFTMTMQVGGTAPHATPAGVPGGDGVAGTAASPFAEGDVSSPARRLGPLDAAYPRAAREQQIEGDVVLTIVVDATGAVADARVLRQAGFGLDESALRAVRASRFAPAVRGGRPVAVRMKYTVSFALQ